MQYIGIDPGKTGGIAVIEDKKLVDYIPVPTVGKDLNIDFLVKYLKGRDAFCILEDVHSIYGTSAKSNFQFGRVLGVLEGVISASDIPYVKVSPKEWQKVSWKGVEPVKINTGKKTSQGNPKYKIDTKSTSLMAAKRLFPGEEFCQSAKSSKPHDGIVDAVLIAFYGSVKF